MLPLTGLAAVAGSAQPIAATTFARASSSSAHVASSGPAVTGRVDSFSSQIAEDYRRAGPKQRHSFAGANGVEVLVVKYRAEDSVNKKLGQYLLETSLTGSRVNSVTIDEQAALGDSANLSSFNAQREIGKNGRPYWDIYLDLAKSPADLTPATYSYSTGPSDPQESVFPLTMQTFTPIAALTQQVLGEAKAHDAMTLTPLPFPPPTFHP